MTMMIHYNCPLIGWPVTVKSKDMTSVGVGVTPPELGHPPTHKSVTVLRGQLPYDIDFLVDWLLFEQFSKAFVQAGQANTYYINQWSLGHRTFVHNIFSCHCINISRHSRAAIDNVWRRWHALQFIERCAIIGSSYRYWGSINIQCPLDFKPLLTPSASRKSTVTV